METNGLCSNKERAAWYRRNNQRPKGVRAVPTGPFTNQRSLRTRVLLFFRFQRDQENEEALPARAVLDRDSCAPSSPRGGSFGIRLSSAQEAWDDGFLLGSERGEKGEIHHTGFE